MIGADWRFSRRGFLAAAGAAAGAGLIGGSAQAQGLPDVPAHATGRPFPKAELDMPLPPEERLGWCVVGLGSFALNHVIPAITRSQTARLTALVSGNPDKARRVAGHYGVAEDKIYSYDTMSRIADDEAIDVVYIVLPNGLHAEYTVKAFEAGKHVMCEKPMANTVGECRGMIGAAEAAGRKLMIAYRAHFEPHNMRALKMKQEGDLGTVRLVSGSTMRPIDLSRPRDEWRVIKSLAGGGSMMDIGIYALNGALYFLEEEPVALAASISNPESDPRFREVEDLVTVQLHFPSGALANLSTSFTMEENRIGVLGTKGTALLDPATNYFGDRLEMSDPSGTLQVSVPEPSARQFTGEIDHLSRAVLDGSEIATPGAMGLRDVALIQAIYASAERSEWVDLNADGTMRS